MSSSPKWHVAKASVAGRGHLERNIPCQDSHATLITKEYVVLAVADGAGSQSHSQIGSRVACETVLKSLELVCSTHQWHRSGALPTAQEWAKVRRGVLKNVLDALQKEATKEGIELRSMACTLMACIITEAGIMGFHVGDGRACYQDHSGDWVALLTPFKGEFANETVFLTSAPVIAQDDDQFVSDFLVVTGGKVPVALLTDGCEMHSFECHVVNHETMMYSDPNKPFPGFFNPILGTLQQLSASSTDQEIDAIWEQFLKEGTEGLKNEADDKTMVVAYWQ